MLNQLLETVLAKDKEFMACRAEHPDSYVPLPRREKKQVATIDRAAGVTEARRGGQRGREVIAGRSGRRELV